MSSVTDFLTAPLLKSPAPPSMETISINTIRTLCIDGIQAANSGHPGTPMAMAPVAYSLWQQFLRFDPQDPVWPNRDRFVLSDRARVHAALFPASFDRSPGGQQGLRNSGRGIGATGRHQDVSTIGQPLSGTSGVPLDVGRRNHNRAAWPGRCPPAWAWLSPGNGWRRATTALASRISSTSTSTRFAETDA